MRPDVTKSVVLDSGTVFGRECFPLALAPVEQFMIWSESPAFPKSFRVVQTFDGTLCRETLRKAFSIAIVRHPLLWASIKETKGALHWNVPDQRSFDFCEAPSGYEHSPFPASFDLLQNCGARFWYRIDDNQSELVSEYHHACCDGLGAQQFLQDWFLAYHQISQGRDTADIKLPKMTLEHLTKRGVFARAVRQENTESLSFLQKAILAYRFHCQPPSWLASQSVNSVSQSTSQSSGSLYSRWTIEGPTLEQTDEVLLRHDLSLHEFSIAVLLRTLAEHFVTERGHVHSRIRIMFPTSHRSHQDRRAGAINRIGFAFVSTRSDECTSIDSSLGVSRRQLEGIQKYELGLDFVDQLTGLVQRPWLAKRVLKWQRPWATAIMTNLGHYGHRLQRLFEWDGVGFRIGNVVMTSVTGVPPLQPYTHLGIGLSRHFRQISVLFRCSLGDADSTRFRCLLEKNWMNSLGTLQDG